MYSTFLFYLLALSASLFSLIQLSTADDCKSDLTNGCGSDDFNFDGPYTDAFNSACVKHDHCYNCGKHEDISASRTKCDDWFNSNMKKICKGKTWWKQPTCYLSQVSYYGIVRAVGSLFYRSNPKSYCSESWVSDCIR